MGVGAVSGSSDSPARRIEAFIAAHADADIVVCTGFTSVWGLAWLAEKIDAGQGCVLIAGDLKPQRFKKGSDEKRARAVAFLRRRNVRVHHWYRKKPEEKMAHGKAVAALGGDGKVVDALVGSANLTRAGLERNLELMVRCEPSDLRNVDAYIAKATRHDPMTDKLIGLVRKGRAGVGPSCWHKLSEVATTHADAMVTGSSGSWEAIGFFTAS